MPKTVFESAFKKLSEEDQNLTSSWFSECSTVPEFCDILDNIKLQDNLTGKVFFDFWNDTLNKITSRLTVSESLTISGKICYEDACKNFLFKGKISSVHPTTVLYSLINEIDLKEIVCTAMGYTDIDSAWENFWDVVLDDNDRIEILSNAGYSNWKFIIWAYFDPYLGESGSKIDPLKLNDVNQICAKLGLPAVWNKYKLGQTLWKLKMLTPDFITKRIPSIADAGWNEYFQIADSSKGKIKWGWTRPLKSLRGTRGMPEVVLKCWESSKVKGVFHELPDHLGIRIS